MAETPIDRLGKALTEDVVGKMLVEQTKYLEDRRSGFRGLDKETYSKLRNLDEGEIGAIKLIVQSAIIETVQRMLISIRDLGDFDDGGEGIFLIDRKQGREDLNLSYADENGSDLFSLVNGEESWLARFGPEGFRHL